MQLWDLFQKLCCDVESENTFSSTFQQKWQNVLPSLNLAPFLYPSFCLCGASLTVLFIPDKVWDAEGGGKLQFHIRMPLQERQKEKQSKSTGHMVSMRRLST